MSLVRKGVQKNSKSKGDRKCDATGETYISSPKMTKNQRSGAKRNLRGLNNMIHQIEGPGRIDTHVYP